MSSAIEMNDSLYQYLLEHSLRQQPVEIALREYTRRMPEAKMMSAPESSQFLVLLLRLMKATRAIEVGVYTGVTTLAMALALPESAYILALDNNVEWTHIAKRYWKEAGIDHKIDLRLGLATEQLQSCIDDGQAGSFDFAFIDANKEEYLRYYELCLSLLRPGGLMVFDNALMRGRVADPTNLDAGVVEVRQVLERMHDDQRLDTSLIPVADGLALGLKRA